ncbi:retinol dehydrogenase 12-like [Lucilia sericata]|uniref:retinol dehydrogenase 12-like n=1 Tax=Lucilia sericata TaxID=13632 RepID=UPI0018A83768|nr:retinol dehydrogenase 12-like [Lucilia sericata]
MTLEEILNCLPCSDQLQIWNFKGGPVICWSVLTFAAMFAFYKWREGPRYTEKTRLDGKVVLITGCNTGIGKETVLELAKRGAKVYMACRNFEKCEEARKEIVKLTGNTQVFNRTLDLSSLSSVREFAEHFLKEQTRLDILINNAGILSTNRQLTPDGYEQHLAVNHLGHFLLTNLLMDLIKASAPSRIIVVSSLAYILGNFDKEDINIEKGYTRYKAYGRSKLANILFTRKLSSLLKESSVSVNCLHPGVVQTELMRHDPLLNLFRFILSKFIFRSTRGGAQTTLFLAMDPEVQFKSGGFYDKMKLYPLLAKAKDDDMADWLWQESENMVGLRRK